MASSAFEDQDSNHLPSKISIMLVDDDPAFLTIMQTWLEKRHSGEVEVVGTARSGEDCLALAQLLAPQVVLMDLQMPGMGGLGTIPLLHILFPQTRIIATTSDDSARNRRLVLAAGGHDLVSKSAVRAQLFPAIRRALDIDVAEALEFA